jgi:uncharacterized protein YndB with AHSA1/START domain
MNPIAAFDPALDLKLERYVNVPPEKVWAAWTDPDHVVHWFTPAPWKTVSCDIDLRPGGAFRTVMRSPEGQDFPNAGCYLEIVPQRRLVWTSALQPGYRPATVTITPGHECAELLMTAVISIERKGTGTLYTALALHPDAASSRRHAEMGFEEGWGKALDQLVAYMSGR